MSTTYHPPHPGDAAAMRAMRAELARHPPLAFSPTIRPRFASLMLETPTAAVAYEAAEVGGVRGWRCRPQGAAPRAAILYLHGGAYVAGSAFAFRHLAGHIAVRAETAAFVADYGLAPERPFRARSRIPGRLIAASSMPGSSASRSPATRPAVGWRSRCYR